jgi:hypothetical protein
MSDLFDTLHVLVNDDDAPPVPPAEIRRRGDRMRRRRIALQAVALSAVAAVIAVAIAIAFGGSGAEAATQPSTFARPDRGM